MGEVIPFPRPEPVNKRCANCAHWRNDDENYGAFGVCGNVDVDEYETNSDWHCAEHSLAKNVDL